MRASSAQLSQLAMYLMNMQINADAIQLCWDDYIFMKHDISRAASSFSLSLSLSLSRGVTLVEKSPS